MLKGKCSQKTCHQSVLFGCVGITISNVEISRLEVLSYFYKSRTTQTCQLISSHTVFAFFVRLLSAMTPSTTRGAPRSCFSHNKSQAREHQRPIIACNSRSRYPEAPNLCALHRGSIYELINSCTHPLLKWRVLLQIVSSNFC
jgi:hypothetical protein